MGGWFVLLEENVKKNKGGGRCEGVGGREGRGGVVDGETRSLPSGSGACHYGPS